MPNNRSSIYAPIQEKLALAHQLYSTWGSVLLKDTYIYGLLEKLKQEVNRAKKTMRMFGIVDICRHCDEEEGGSCCGAGIENRYTLMLLLINLLLGEALPKERYKTSSCYFLNENGCGLIARHVLCVNYLCSKIKQTLPPDDLIRLQSVEGEELHTLFMLHEAIKKVTSESNDEQQRISRDDFVNREFL